MPGPLNGTTPEPRISASTGSTPAPIATPIQGSCRRGTPIRPAEVNVATVNIKKANAIDHPTEASAAAMTRDTTPSWTTARMLAVSWSRPTPSRPTYDAVIATATSTTSTTANGQPGVGAELLPLAAACTTPDAGASGGTG